ncbi:hypothetical protein [Epilithonimonas sp.]|uniref:hypothetical protein n=1 Tax=Epilithonimonas sp. TaxID=2894511 RepID=UPI0035B19D14
MKNFLIFVCTIICYSILIYLDKTYISTSSKIFDFLSKDYPSDVVQNYMESQKKWWWVSYAVTPVLIGIKVLLVAFCMNFIKLLDLPGLEKVKFSDFVFLALIAEFVFVLAGIYKFVNFYCLDTDYTLETLQTYYPISLINLREQISMEKWLAYPLQLVNLFELFYWGILAYGIYELSGGKLKPVKSFGLVTMTYGVGLLFWTGVVCFLILSVQY